ncbi:hypothetical protein TSA6c_17445 [Azospirillum sp. TSA6c]|uniref:hypothetical protein n=1 Tax=Azospirillum sp. TSA6c TaxID=709813 RepID=UPI000D61ACC7|nr:hypothetical protein [Azospirillum sp. TSA6c]PWC48206.1 hypothetical protein TSA6c_17445 [Azospirillum sp. TSA6c]
MLKRIKLIERFNSAYMLCAFGDLYISKVAPGWKAPWFRGKVTGQGLWVVVPRNGNMHRCQTLWAALKHADATGSFKPLERFYGSRPDLIDIDTALAEAGEHPGELADIKAAEQSGYNAFVSLGGRLMDALPGTKPHTDLPDCPYRRPDHKDAWNAGRTRAETQFHAACSSLAH